MAMQEVIRSDRELANLVVVGEPNTRGTTDLFVELRSAVHAATTGETPSVMPLIEEDTPAHHAHAPRVSRLVELGLAEFQAGQLVATETGHRVFAQTNQAS